MIINNIHIIKCKTQDTVRTHYFVSKKNVYKLLKFNNLHMQDTRTQNHYKYIKSILFIYKNIYFFLRACVLCVLSLKYLNIN